MTGFFLVNFGDFQRQVPLWRPNKSLASKGKCLKRGFSLVSERCNDERNILIIVGYTQKIIIFPFFHIFV